MCGDNSLVSVLVAWLVACDGIYLVRLVPVCIPNAAHLQPTCRLQLYFRLVDSCQTGTTVNYRHSPGV